jgi:hypothetical protein
MELLNFAEVHQPALTVSSATNAGPEGQWKLARLKAGEAQRNHRNPPNNGFRPGGAAELHRFPALLRGASRFVSRSGGWRHRLISVRPPGGKEHPR